MSAGFASLLRRWADRIDPPPESRSLAGAEKKAALRREVFGSIGFRCVDCRTEFPEHTDPYLGEGIRGLTLGHIIPAGMGGELDVDNLLPQCIDCNKRLRDRVWYPGWYLLPLGALIPDPCPVEHTDRIEWLKRVQQGLRAAA